MTEHTLTETEHDAITDAAAHWCMRLHAHDCTEQERQAFEQWRDAHPLHAFEYEAMLEIWDVAGDLPRPEPVAAPVRRQVQSAWRTWGVAAAICALAVPLAGYGGWQLGWVPNTYQHFESTDNVRTVTLKDGSQVELNLGTELTYSNYKDQRQVTLKKGEAFFSVSHDTRHPFVVKAAEGRIRVTGTKFNVWMYEDQVKVNLIEGSVLVSSNDDLTGDGLRLGPAMQASYGHGDFIPRISQTYENDSSLAWRQGKLVLDDLALNEALPLINRYLDKPLRVADNSTGAIRIGGIYNIKEINGLVKSLPRVLPVYLTRNQDGDLVVNAIPQKSPKT
ncbi:FecR family protein [Pseudomonas vancouverensis]|uniref:FecR family protein n=1 Tax=Pseudomonas vancouverensis TaxID=95300 RepID=A0A1H2NDI7_PSEVA|nr:FecR family protein [Pseudomonas vancouverensis]KAB0494177.1 FecR family protein [Pseudomonas vancouverensis]TDB60485.1 FecR family protein [Pseudomonas vancouverensis]SDV03145.1 FecR family protein [Pseudomonas vancouverensis]